MQPPNNTHEDRWKEIKDTWKFNAWLWVVPGVFLGLVIGFLLGVSSSADVDNWFVDGIWPEALSTVIAVALIYHLDKLRDDRREKERLKTELLWQIRSRSTSVAVSAFDRMRHEKWLTSTHDLRGLEIRDAQWEKADLTGVDLQGSELIRADLRDAKLESANLEAVTLRMADLRDSYLVNANLRQADLDRADFEGANMQHVNLEGADLQTANLRNANLRFANLKDANLMQANLQGVDLIGANLSGANLKNAYLLNVKNLHVTGLVQTTLPDGIVIDPSDLEKPEAWSTEPFLKKFINREDSNFWSPFWSKPPFKSPKPNSWPFWFDRWVREQQNSSEQDK